MDLALGPEGLASRGTVVPLAQIRGFVERFDPWTGRLTVEVLGPGWRLPIGPGWGAIRRELRAALPDRPFTSTWDSGRFPPAWGELPFVVGALAVAAASAYVAASVGPVFAAAVAVVAAWPVARLRDAVRVVRKGMSAGPPWAPIVRWDEVEAVHVSPSGLVWARTRYGTIAARVPPGLIPAVRGRVRRLGRLEISVAEPDLDARYAAWRAPARGIPWGVALGTAAVAGAAADPALTLAGGLAVAALLTALGAAAEARATGWGFGAVGWLTATYAGFLALVGAVGLAA